MRQDDSRIENFDLLRGFFIFLALWQHFAYYLNIWYVDYFHESGVLEKNYMSHKHMIGYNLPVDFFSHWAAWFFTPWVSQVYLTLAAFNLAKRTKEDFQEVFKPKMKIFGLLYFFFVMENLIVAPNFGEGISFYPIMSWMVILILISVLFKYFGLKGVIGLMVLSFGKWLLPDSFLEQPMFEYWMQEHVHAQYEFDAQVDYFLTSGCLGFILGYIHHHKSEWGFKREAWQSIVGFLLFLIWFIWGDAFTVNFMDVFESEHDLADDPIGLLSILGVQLMVLSGFLFMEKKGIQLKLPILHWVGVNSLTVFAFHRVVFVFFLVPFMMIIANWSGTTLLNNWYVCWGSVLLTFGFTWLIQKLNLHNLIVR
ncbi:MAG: hypothetical protein KC493_10390 [Bacteriovoracaceae bacterium]|nr:hypothetical protein [Bacteriovoracaceae bacterium]